MSYTNEEMNDQFEAMDYLIDKKDKVISDLLEACKIAIPCLPEEVAEELQQAINEAERE